MPDADDSLGSARRSGAARQGIDVAFAPPEVAINAALKGTQIKGVVSGATLNVFQIVARNELKIPDGGKDFKAMMTALKGMKIGVPARGSGAELQFAILAEKAGLKPADYTYVAVGAPNTSFGALSSKQIDASVTFEPSASICDVTKGLRRPIAAPSRPSPRKSPTPTAHRPTCG
ncbi:MAG: ABC transporter substrate-binding protein [Methylobacteriaceae bacterium]|nr:ABC transporter substrate-binding protein [Methylobacteriaceae bacterium]